VQVLLKISIHVSIGRRAVSYFGCVCLTSIESNPFRECRWGVLILCLNLARGCLLSSQGGKGKGRRSGETLWLAVRNGFE
jgi:hypothetical protein